MKKVTPDKSLFEITKNPNDKQLCLFVLYSLFSDDYSMF